MTKTRTGFVYIWYDSWRKMYYIGSHLGTIDDGYICSSNRMRDAYRRRPDDFKRRIIQRFEAITYKELLEQEEKWLQKAEKKKDRYYNLNFNAWHWAAVDLSRKTVSEKLKGQKRTEETKQKIRIARAKQAPLSKESKEKISIKLKEYRKHNKQIHSEETKEKLRQINLGKKHSEETRKKIANSHKGQKRSQEFKDKMKIISKIRGITPENRAKMIKAKNNKYQMNKINDFV